MSGTDGREPTSRRDLLDDRLLRARGPPGAGGDEIRDRVRAFCDEEVTPRITDFRERAESPFEPVPRIAELGIAGGTSEGYDRPR